MKEITLQVTSLGYAARIQFDRASEMSPTVQLVGGPPMPMIPQREEDRVRVPNGATLGWENGDWILRWVHEGKSKQADARCVRAFAKHNLYGLQLVSPLQ